MKTRGRRQILLLACVLLIASSLLSGCVRPPPTLEKGPFAEIMPKSAGDDMRGKRVRWGGTIIASPRISEQESCFKVSAAELDVRARPVSSVTNSSSWYWYTAQGSFFVCLPGFYDPAIYRSGRVITVTGTVRAIESHLHKVHGETIYLWPKSRPYREWDHGWWDPFWDDDC